jgi:hypothetical protein
MLLEVFLILVEHPIEPRKQLLGTMVSVQDDGNSVNGSNGADVMRTGNRTSDTCGLIGIGNTFA